MKRHNFEEHGLCESTYISKVHNFLSENYPDRFRQLSSIDVAVIASGLQEIDERYGDDSTLHLKYHDVSHTWDAWEDFCMYSEVLTLESDEFVDGSIAVTRHDWEQTLGSGANEAASAVEVQRVMGAHGYDEGRQIHAANCVLVTEAASQDGALVQPRLKEFGPDKTILAVALADMNGITLRGEGTMVDHAFRLALEFGRVTFEDIRRDPTCFIEMLKGQYSYVGTRLSTFEDAVSFHVDDEQEAHRVISELNARYETQSSRAINAAKSFHESIRDYPEQATTYVRALAIKAIDEAEFVQRVAHYATQQALARIACKQKNPPAT